MSERNDARVQREAPNGIVQFQLLREDGRYYEALYALDRDGVLWRRVLWHGQWGPWGRSDATGHETAGSEAEEREAVRQVTEYSAANTGRIVERIKTALQERLVAVAPSPALSAEEKQGSHPAPVAPAPIPLGAVVDVDGDSDAPYRREDNGWRTSRCPRPWLAEDGDGHDIAPLITALYHARHPVATLRAQLAGVREKIKALPTHPILPARSGRAFLTVELDRVLAALDGAA